ncbi:NADP-dependent 3-hydroxy acid dehydrogenase YdfG [Streptomyces sp. SAI-208]|uniref:SDR family oxidoreductase n=1 Tax=unclassified Streptomyces TaxID=2593676 RepID=UPI002475DC79|nr:MULTISPECIES: SDR family oxidoreductase [unclassified Streptomyces]MDH6518576.1 NADP-dependent 3-hydroxy acid dehydrogenase YdfG [Streptomyces sp. SAI-090]MDH6550795.1 NADP-dependent 3-hydroxy acid dehydrogenase YdfG [Streptomyces sp. SAI-041]MDH6569858.1 NADP-dependent 3-hydroxy acid dehydrogenase YdfG [Streptomyces sp. SAI-117]MDH6609422.1 NADP-dependent 3-hydroxy acid dehydrogenase YdfG [Streptomyces sp. SAI-208]MDH6617331.1 NADP-dependent 3-hydroxy acid dehydrogenase YdfG [Streptomyces 
MSYENLAGRTAVVTGAASGIGEATAVLLAERGARVALLARRGERLETIAGKIRAEGGQALAVVADVTDDASVAAAVRSVHAAFGTVDLVVNNAGVMLPNPIADARVDEWQRMIDTNVTGVLRIIGAFAGDLNEAAAQGRSADLVNVSSIGAHITGFTNYAVYGATKAAVTHLSALLRNEFGPQGVRVTNIEPGLTESELATHIEDAGLREQIGGLVEATGSLAAAELADVVAYVTSRPRHVNLRQVMVLPTAQV